MDFPAQHSIVDDASLSDNDLLNMLRTMLEIRGLEDEIQRAFTKDLVRGSTHLCNGQEAGAVGACTALRSGDTMLCTYRGHGAVIAMGASFEATFAEILGRETGSAAARAARCT